MFFFCSTVYTTLEINVSYILNTIPTENGVDCAQKEEILLTGQKIFAGNSWRTTDIFRSFAERGKKNN